MSGPGPADGFADEAADEADGEAAAALTQVRRIFGGQGFMTTIGAVLGTVRRGHVEIVVPIHPGIAQHDGFAHAGVVTTALDTASGCAAVTLQPPGSGVLTIDFTVHLPRPALGEHVLAVADVVNAGRRVTFVRAEAFAVAADGSRKICGLMTATMANAPSA